MDGELQADIPLPDGYGVYGDYDPIWSGDGESLMIRMRRDPGSSPSEFWLLPVHGGPARRFAENAGVCCPSYSPDRALVVYVAFSTDGLPGSLLVSPADAPNAARTVASDISLASIGRPIWSPAGDLVAVTKGSINDAGTEWTYGLQIVDIATGRLTSLRSGRAAQPARALAFSPDGERILFNEVGADGMSSLWSVTVDGTGVPRQVVAGATWGEWQPTAR
ncbi:MAG: hypothetical protein H0W41_05620 [Chloroflexi bacterium]|nr:hypothetical protein [Chloroflexota bacterium]